MTPAERQVLWPLVTAVIGATEKTALVQLFHDLAEVLNTVAEEHKSKAMALSLGIATHFPPTATAPDSSAKDKVTIDVPGLSYFDHDSESDNENESDNDSMSHSDSEYACLETEPAEHQSDHQGARVRNAKTIREFWNSLDGDDMTWIDASYQRNVGLKFRINDTTIGNASLMEDLRRKAFAKLNNCAITTINQFALGRLPLGTRMAYSISVVFFKDMISPVCDRVHDIIHAHAYMAATQAGMAKGEDQDAGTPQIFKDIYITLAALRSTDAKSNAISTLRHQIELCRLSNRWGQIRQLVSESPLTPEGARVLSLCGPPSPGVNNISRAAAGICDGIGMDKGTFQLYLKNAALPASLVQVFGHGGIMFAESRYVPPTHAVLTRVALLADDPPKHSGTSNIIQASGATQIFEVIKSVDTRGVLQRIADCLAMVIVDYLWEDELIAWDSKKLVDLDPKMPLLPLLKAMHETIED